MTNRNKTITSKLRKALESGKSLSAQQISTRFLSLDPYRQIRYLKEQGLDIVRTPGKTARSAGKYHLVMG